MIYIYIYSDAQYVCEFAEGYPIHSPVLISGYKEQYTQRKAAMWNNNCQVEHQQTQGYNPKIHQNCGYKLTKQMRDIPQNEYALEAKGKKKMCQEMACKSLANESLA